MFYCRYKYLSLTSQSFYSIMWVQIRRIDTIPKRRTELFCWMQIVNIYIVQCLYIRCWSLFWATNRCWMALGLTSSSFLIWTQSFLGPITSLKLLISAVLILEGSLSCQTRVSYLYINVETNICIYTHACRRINPYRFYAHMQK